MAEYGARFLLPRVLNSNARIVFHRREEFDDWQAYMRGPNKSSIVTGLREMSKALGELATELEKQRG